MLDTLHRIHFAVAFFLFLLIATAAFGQEASKDPSRKPFQICSLAAYDVDDYGGIIADGTVIFASLTGGRVGAIDFLTGEPLWTAELGGRAASVPVAANGKVLAATSGALSGRVFALSATTGLTIWSSPLPPASRYFVYATAAGVAVVSDHGEITVLRNVDGNIISKTASSGTLSIEPAASPYALMIAAIDGTFAINSVDGEVLFRRKLESPAAAGLLFGKSWAVYSDVTGRIYAMKTAGGRTIWKFKTGGKVSQLVMFRGNILASSADNFVYLLQAESGSVHWKVRLPGRIERLAVIDEHSIAATVIGENQVFIIDAQKGRLVDSVNLPSDGRPLRVAPIGFVHRLAVAATNGIAIFSPDCAAKIQTAGRRKPAI
ncbi:MAG: hypothetical protein C4324_07185 [Blastocatellia bacterium]